MFLLTRVISGHVGEFSAENCSSKETASKWRITDSFETYRVIHKSLRDFRPPRYGRRDGHAEGEHVNRGRDTPSFCTTLQVLDMSTLGDAAVVNPVINFLLHTCNVCGRNLITGLTLLQIIYIRVLSS